MKVDEAIFETIMKAEKITLTNYGEEIIWKDAENIDGYITSETLLTIIDDLIHEVYYLEEKIEDLENPGEYDEHTAYQDQCLEEGIL